MQMAGTAGAFWQVVNHSHQRMLRWSKSGVLERVFEALKDQMNVPPEALSMDSTSIKVHPDGTGALKKRPAVHRKI